MNRSLTAARWLLLLLLLPFGWASGGSATADEQSIRDVVRRWDAAWNSRDMATMAALLTENADFVNVAGLH